MSMNWYKPYRNMKDRFKTNRKSLFSDDSYVPADRKKGKVPESIVESVVQRPCTRNPGQQHEPMDVQLDVQPDERFGGQPGNQRDIQPDMQHGVQRIEQSKYKDNWQETTGNLDVSADSEEKDAWFNPVEDLIGLYIAKKKNQ